MTEDEVKKINSMTGSYLILKDAIECLEHYGASRTNQEIFDSSKDVRRLATDIKALWMLMKIS